MGKYGKGILKIQKLVWQQICILAASGPFCKPGLHIIRHGNFVLSSKSLKGNLSLKFTTLKGNLTTKLDILKDNQTLKLTILKNDLTIKFIISKDDVKVDNFKEQFTMKVEHFSADGKYEVRLMTKAELKYTGFINKTKLSILKKSEK